MKMIVQYSTPHFWVQQGYDSWVESDQDNVDEHIEVIDHTEGYYESDVEQAIAFLRDNGGVIPSASSFDTWVWYSKEVTSQESCGDDWVEESFHLKGFSDKELMDIFETITA